MGLTTVPRRVAKLEYSAVRLPFALFEEHVVARYWDDEALIRLGFERFLGSLDGFAGWLLADDDIAWRGRALRRRTEFLAKSRDLDTRARDRRAHAEENLQAAEAAARQARAQAHEEMEGKIAAAWQQGQEDTRHVREEADAWAEAQKADAQRAAQTSAAAAEDTRRAEQERISAEEDRAAAVAAEQMSDAAETHTSAMDRRQDADRLGELAAAERDERRSS